MNLSNAIVFSLVHFLLAWDTTAIPLSSSTPVKTYGNTAANAAQHSRPKIGVLIHGCNTRADDWEEIVWGDVKTGLCGRIAHTFAVLRSLRSLVPDDDSILSAIIWGSGVASHMPGFREGQYTLEMAKMGLRSLLSDYPGRFGDVDEPEFDALHSVVTRVSVSEDTSCNTLTEIEGAFRIFEKNNVDIIILVSSATHAPRCLRDASRVLAAMNRDERRDSNRIISADRKSSNRKPWSPLVFATPSATCYANSSPEDVIVAEPPHLPVLKHKQNNNRARNKEQLGADAEVEVEVDAMATAEMHSAIRRRNALLKRVLHIETVEKMTRFNQRLEDLLDALSSDD